MRPLLLQMSAFGPYADKITIPMRELGASGLYLIAGDTGAGKTTIFDAICFALFGEASGENREPSMFRSKYAKESTPTEVVLSFEHGKKEYEIQRNPEYLRPAKRGDGWKKEIAGAQLRLPDGQVITKVRDVNAAVVELLGMNREQFSQIAMLAQGDFLKLLLADTKDRQKIFRELFQTGFYQTLQYRLEEERKRVYCLCEDAKKSYGQYVCGIACREDDVSALEVEKAKSGALTVEETLDLAGRLINRDQEVLQQLNADIGGMDVRLLEVQKRIGKAEETERTKKSLAQAVKSLAKEQAKEQELKSALEEAKKALGKKEELQRQMSAIEAELPNYQIYGELTAGIKKAKAAITRTEKALAKKSEEEQEKTLEAEQRKKERETLSDAGAERERLQAKKEKLDAELEAMEELKGRFDEYTKKKAALTRAQKKYASDDAAFQEKKSIYESLDQAFRDGQAGILASTLQDGQPCPVCGSTSHPKLAALAKEVPSQEQLKAAKAEAEKARDTAEKSSRKAGELKSTLAMLGAELWKSTKKLLESEKLGQTKEMPEPEDIGNEKELLELVAIGEAKQLLEAEDADKAKELLLETRNAVEKRSTQLAARIDEEQKKIQRKAELETLIPAMESELKQLSASIGKKKEDLAAARSKLEADTAQAKTLKKKLTYEDQDAANACYQSLENQCRTLQDAYDKGEKACQKQTAAVNTRKGQIEGYEQTLQSASDINLEAEREQNHVLTEQRSEKLKESRLAATRLDTNKDILEHISKKSKELAAAEKQLQWITALSDTANGKLRGKEKVMLETFIQMTYFDRIINRANVRLMKMSGGQYELKRVEESQTTRGQSGLALGVIDHYNGSERSVKTLSGGESFLASLSLALGLSEEVQSQAGGIQVDTLFVDEGFGSLDPDSLELAYRALAGLTEGNRLVGIISHVGDLKEKIDRQIVVTKKKSGGSFVSMQL